MLLLQKNQKKLSAKKLLPLILPFLFLAGIWLGVFASQKTDREFDSYTRSLFVSQLSGSTLSLHYTLADPAAWDLDRQEVSLGSAVAEDPAALRSFLENSRSLLESFPYESLSRENQLTYDILHLFFDTELSAENEYILAEVLSPALGIQAQLPSLLAEYTLRSEKDVIDYLNLLRDIPSYFETIIDFEKEKADRGYFMSDATADRIIDQCSDFISSGDNNYLNAVFSENLEQVPGLDETQKENSLRLHRDAVKHYVLPAYENLISALTSLKGSGTNENGLYYLSGGRAYYTYLLKSSCGIYDSVEELQTRLANQLLADYKEIRAILEEDPSLAASLLQENSQSGRTPEQILSSLQEQIKKDFPEISDVAYEVKYIHEDLKEHLSPAFYLTPPIDTGSPNLIYLNPDSRLRGIELYTTLAHEGFPGHLYQSQFFLSKDHPAVRHTLNMGGYVEGWATYIESYAYLYGSKNQQLGRLHWLNRAMNLCLYSLLDIGIHYYGWTCEKAAKYLENFGVSDRAVCREIFQIIVEDPANYLKYYGGCLKFMDLKEEASRQEDFHPIDFHEKVLETGPCQFPILEKYVLQ
ncbi:MAG TPA: DUF885 domain-containing protein [Candidatus Ruminococcus avistercoris]|nr:DUF885 domain-containing protein [Candidatus Ruminococcus avistercoris]